MNKPAIPNDIARCVGTPCPMCQECLRNQPIDNMQHWYITPAYLEGVGCHDFLGDSKSVTNTACADRVNV